MNAPIAHCSFGHIFICVCTPIIHLDIETDRQFVTDVGGGGGGGGDI